jgi:hypothetical protein
MALANGLAEGLGVLVLKCCLVLGIFYGASLVHHDGCPRNPQTLKPQTISPRP